MLSPGEWYQRVPKDLRENLEYRLWLAKRCADNPEAQQAVRQACSEDLLFYINSFVWQFNPRKKGKDLRAGPFITWDFQDKALLYILDCIENDQDLCIEKSREMGASWMCLITMEWLWHFKPWMQFLCISRNEKAVEDESPDSLFWKIDFIQSYLPDWLLPRMRRRKLYYGNEETGSTVTGEASTGAAGVGGRASAMFIDEFSQIKEDYDVLHRTSDTTGCRIFNFTHVGMDKAAFELTQRVDMRKLRLHWSQHPDKKAGLYCFDRARNKVVILDKEYPFPADYQFIKDGSPAGGPCPGIRSPWYDAQCLRKGDARGIAMDLDIDPKGSVSQFFNPLTLRILQEQYCQAPWWQGELLFDNDLGKPLELVKKRGGSLKLWCHLDGNGKPPRGRYGMGADISAGQGATNSCLSVVNSQTGEKVAEVATPHVDPARLAPLAVALCWLFGTEEGEGAGFAWEHHGPGLVFGKRVIELGYRNILFRTQEAPNRINKKVTDVPGWFPTPQTILVLLSEYREALEKRQFLNRSSLALDECLAFEYDASGNVQHSHISGKNDPSGARVNHGDRTIADALAWKMCRNFYVGVKRQEEAQVPLLSLAWRRLFAKSKEKEEQFA